MFLKNKNIIFKIRRSKVTDYAALTKACQIITTFTESLHKNMGILPYNIKKFILFIKELYARLHYWYMFEALSLLVH